MRGRRSLGTLPRRAARRRRPGLRTAAAVALGALIAGGSCAPAPDTELVPRSTLFIGVDVSGSFQKGGRYDDALAFAAHYIHAHLAGAGGLEQPRALFVGAIGGEKPGQPQAFHPIHDFEGKPVEQIEADLRAWFPPDDNYTDFSAFFQRAAALVKRQNLVLAPVTLVLLTDGIPDVGRGGPPIDEAARYANIDLDPLEYLARNITVRVLYPDPAVAVHWERSIPRDRVRMWTVDAVVMKGWREQLRPVDEGPRVAADAGAPEVGEPSGAEVDQAADAEAGAADAAAEPAVARAAVLPTPPRESLEQPDLWRWMRDNIDFRVRRSVL